MIITLFKIMDAQELSDQKLNLTVIYQEKENTIHLDLHIRNSTAYLLIVSVGGGI